MPRRVVALSALLLALLPAAMALDIADARHLLARTGFGATPAEVAPLLGLDRRQAVAALLAGARTTPIVLLPSWSDDNPLARRPKAESPRQEREAFRKTERERAAELERWWYHEMEATDSPFTERMVLFWHNHFTSSLQKVPFPELLLRQNLLLRRMALGNYATMLHEIARDPAMVLYLDSQTNVKRHPNENFARELLELFTLGEGHYSEADVRQVARAFTGWRVDPATGLFSFDSRRHDGGPKTVFGRTGAWNGDDVVDLVLQRPEAATFVVQALWREFVSPQPDPAEVASLAALFRSGGYQIKPLMEALLSRDAFWSAPARGSLVKSPVELLVGLSRLLDLADSTLAALPRMGRSLGQEVFNPPTVRGWPGGEAWIDSRTLLERRRYVAMILKAAEEGSSARPGPSAAGSAAPAGGSPSPAPDACTSRIAGLRQWASQEAASPGEALASLLLPLPPSHPVSQGFPGALRAVLMDEVYQLD